MAFDFPASPSNGQSFSPAGGPTWVYDAARGAWGAVGANNTGVTVSDTPPSNPFVGQLWHESDSGSTFIWVDDGNSTQWVQFNIAPAAPIPGSYKISSGTLAVAAANFDIALPTGYHAFELLVANSIHATTASQALMRLSLDGSTFLASGNYSWVFNKNSAVNTPSAGDAQNHIYITPAVSLGATNYKLTMPVPGAGNPQYVMTEAMGSDGGAYFRSTGMGVLTSAFGPALALRLLPASGNIAAGMRWQLNGVK